jgi:hypothetical protein
MPCVSIKLTPFLFMMLMRKVVLAFSKLVSLLAFEFDVGGWIIAKSMGNGSHAGVMNSRMM